MCNIKAQLLAIVTGINRYSIGISRPIAIPATTGARTATKATLLINSVINNINTISKEIAQDVENVVISLQFQDIISQKLTGMFSPIDELNQILGELVKETLGLDTDLVDYLASKKQRPASELSISNIEKTINKPDHDRPREPEDKKEPPDALNGPAIELF